MTAKLLTPGPTPIPDNVITKMARPMIHHRTREFRELFGRVQAGLKELFQTKEEVVVLTSSGTGAMEAAIANLFKKGDKALTIEMGKFSERWGEVCEAFEIPVSRHRLEWGRSCSPIELENLLKQSSDYKAICLTHCETSTAAIVDLEALAKVIHQYSDALIVVDGITSVGVIPLLMDSWGLDVVISASQKAFRCPAGLAFIACSKRAWKAIESGDRHRFYFDLRKVKDSLASSDMPFTPAISLFFGLEEALQTMVSEGVQTIWSKHKILAFAFRKSVNQLGFELLADIPSDSVTAIKIPDSLKKDNLKERLKEKGVVVVGGQGKLKGEILRVSHMGDIDVNDLSGFLSTIEEILIEKGWKIQKGIAESKFQDLVQTNNI